MLSSSRSKWLIGAALVALAAVAGVGAARLFAQQPPTPTLAPPPMAAPGGSAGGQAAAPQAAAAPAKPSSVDLGPRDPARKIPFSQAPRGPVQTVRRRAGSHLVTYLLFTSRTDRVYRVELPAELAKEPRSKDDWITLFAAYGRDPVADADTRALQGLPLVDNYSLWATAHIATQSVKVATTRDKLTRLVARMNQWSAIHQEAKDNGDKDKARTAWNVIANAKYDIRNVLRQLAREKLELAKQYKEANQFQQARTQFQQTASLNVWPYSSEAVAKLRAIDGAQASAAAFSNATIVGTQRIGMSDLYQAAVKAAGTNP